MSFGISLDVPSFSHSIWASGSQSSSNQMHLPEGGLPVVQCGPQAHYIWRKWEKKKKNTHAALLRDAPAQPRGQPTSLQTVLRKIRLSFISYLSCGLHQAAGYEGHLIRPCTTLRCEKALKRFDSPLLRSRKLLAIIDIGFPC